MDVGNFLDKSSALDSITKQSNNPRDSLNQTIIELTLIRPGNDRISIDQSDSRRALTISAQEIVKKLNEILVDKFPDGIETLKPEEVTPQATADRIVTGSVALFSVFKAQNSNLDDEQLLTRFMDTIRGGIKSGYEDASGILEELGAFSFDGVKSSIEETMRLVEEKLVRFEQSKRQELGLSSSIQTDVQDASFEFTLASAGSRLAKAAK